MRRYTILEFKRNVGATTHTYTAVTNGNEFTGDYICATLDNDTKIVTDFICMPNSHISRVKNESGPIRVNFEMGERTTQGTITGFKPNRATMHVLLDGARTQSVDLSTLTKVVRTTAAPAATVVRTTTTPSRSQQGQLFLDLEARILKETPEIRLEKFFKRDLPTTLEGFLIQFFREYNNEKNTIYTSNKSVQTTTGRRRSLGDIFRICKYYYPECTLQQVLTLLYATLPTKMNPGFRTSKCSTIRKRVWYYRAGSNNLVADATTDDEYGNIVSWYTSKL